MGDLSPHFSAREFSVDGQPGGRPSPHFLGHLEALRGRIGRPLPIVSWKRSEAYSRRVVGHRSIWHERGLAVDVPSSLVTVDEAVASGFVGIGVRRGWVVHVDLRPGAVVIFDDPPRPKLRRETRAA